MEPAEKQTSDFMQQCNEVFLGKQLCQYGNIYNVSQTVSASIIKERCDE